MCSRALNSRCTNNDVTKLTVTVELFKLANLSEITTSSEIKTAWNKEVILTELTDLIGDYPGAIR